MSQTHPYTPGEMFNASFLNVSLRVPTGAVVRRLDRYAKVIAPLDATTLLVEERDTGRKMHWAVEENGMPLQVTEMPDIPVVFARSGNELVPMLALYPLMLNAPASFFAELHFAGWKLGLYPMTSPQGLVDRVLHFTGLDVELVKRVEFDQAAMLGWFKQFRKDVWAVLLCTMAGVQLVSEGTAHPPTAWTWRRGSDHAKGKWFRFAVEAQLDAAEAFESRLVR